LDFAELGKVIAGLMGQGIAQASHHAYRSGQISFLKFCAKAGRTPISVTEEVLCWVVAHYIKKGSSTRP